MRILYPDHPQNVIFFYPFDVVSRYRDPRLQVGKTRLHKYNNFKIRTSYDDIKPPFCLII